MIVGHNPTFHDLAVMLVSADDSDGQARLEDGFPTAATALALAVTTWSEVLATGRMRRLRLQSDRLFVPRTRRR